MEVLADTEDESDSTVQCGTLVEFYRRLDTMIKMVGDPDSGIKFTDTKLESCFACAEGRKIKKEQSEKYTGINQSIDVIGGVIFSDLKDPLLTRDLVGNIFATSWCSGLMRMTMGTSSDTSSTRRMR